MAVFMLSLTRVWVFVFAALLALVPFAAKPIVQGGAVILFLLILWDRVRTAQGRPVLSFSRYDLSVQIIGGLLALIVISMLWSVDPGHAAHALPRLTLIFFAGLVLIAGAPRISVPQEKDWGILVAGLSFGMLAVLFLVGTKFQFFAWVRGVEGAPAYVTNKAVGVLTLIAPAVLLPLVTMRHRAAVVSFFWGLALILIMVVATTGQSALLAFCVMLMAYFLPLGSKKIRLILKGLLFFGVMGAPFLVMALWPYAQMMAQNDLLKEASAPERMEVWFAITQKILERPIWGYGFDATQAITHFDTQQIYQPGTRFSHPHNLALQVWVEFGAVGALFLSWALITTLRHILAHPARAVRRLYFTSYAATLSVALVGWGMWQGWWMTLVLLIVFLNLVAGRLIQAQDALAIKPTDSRAIS